MSVFGTIQAFNEAGNIGPAVESMYAAGVDHVVVVDGAWACADGSAFGGRGWFSDDGTVEEAIAAGAEVVTPAHPDMAWAGDGSKRDFLLRASAAGPGDFLLLIDADERLEGRIDLPASPGGHGCVILHNDKPNDLEERTPWLDQAARESVPLLRWFRWSPKLRCVAPGRYRDKGQPIHVYLVEALAARSVALDDLGRAALAALRDVELQLPNDRLTILPLVPGIAIRHLAEASPERIAAKRRYYDLELAPA